ncbi:MAG TPA: phosphatase PAP2 family protein [Rhizomicrobium sp.]|nr:phosphatase PAP2 family protein [Rhizomicrobium sp.]
MRLFVFAAIAALLGVAAFAKDADPGFLKPTALYDPERYLPPPPADGSPRALAELAELKRFQSEATPAQRAAAASDNDNENGTIFGGVLGPAWDLSKLPATAKVINEIVASEGPFSDVAKNEFHRNRPWIVDASIQTCAPHKPSQDHASYPSGHATLGYAMGIVLSNLMPGHAQAIMARSALFAENRLVCGFHFRSDIVAGQQFGTIMAIRLMQTPKFEADMKAARTELSAAHL